jgi:transposase-like protein
VGEITFAVPQVREGGFYPSALENGLRSERALTITLAEMYVQGVSTREVKAITEQLCGTEISSTQVIRATAQLDGVLQE